MGYQEGRDSVAMANLRDLHWESHLVQMMELRQDHPMAGHM